jgi:hypothetical protein
MLDRAVLLAVVVVAASSGCASRPPAPAKDAQAPELAAVAAPVEDSGGAVARGPDGFKELEEPEEPEPPPGPPGRLVVRARGDVGVSVRRKGEKVAEGAAIIPIEIPPAHYTVSIRPPGLPEADLGKVTVFSEKTTELEVAGYGELWVGTSTPGEPAQLFDAAGAKVADGRTCDFWLVPAGSFTVKPAGAEAADVVVEGNRMTSIALGE